MTEVLINHHNAFFRPPQRQRSFAQRILAESTFGIFKDLLQGTLTNIQTRQACEMVSCHVLKHINDPPDWKSACSRGTARVGAGHSNVAQLSHEQQPEKDQAGQDWSKLLAGSGPRGSVGRERTPALLPRQSAVTGGEKFGPKEDERD